MTADNTEDIMLVFLSFVEDPKERSFVEYLYRKHKKRVLFVCTSILGDRSLAEDALEETYLNVLRYERYFTGKSDDDTARLLMKFARNVSINMYNKRKRTAEEELPVDDENFVFTTDADSSELPENAAEKREIVEATKRAIDSLPDETRDVLLMKYYHGMKASEIASVCGSTEAAVNMRLKRAREKILDILKEGGFGDER